MWEHPNSRRRSPSNSPDVFDRHYRRRSAACHPRCSRHRSRSARRSHRSACSISSRWRSPSSSEVSSCSDTARRSHSRRRRGAHASAARSSRGASRASTVQDPNPPIAPVEPPGPSTTGVPDPSARSFTGGLHVPGPSLGHPAEQVMLLIRASVAPRPWTGYDSPRPTVCFVGHSYLFWAGQRAESRPGGRCLGFRNVEVIWRGLRWSQVLPETVYLSTFARSPVILVIHAGGNDLCLLKVAELITLIRADLERIPTFFPEVVIVWSEMIPRVTWQGARDSGSIEEGPLMLEYPVLFDPGVE
ncbi:uncharacterized protein LOC120977888 [Bufo bufo]|uniref:uncharacterized protein LOC120977888 n=1 Tax=Bufo bufo TaxID=8384 RepID=UPI001ABED73F|nr:uncharacterized protein LOC120977888 [Bufo bufo]